MKEVGILQSVFKTAALSHYKGIILQEPQYVRENGAKGRGGVHSPGLPPVFFLSCHHSRQAATPR